MKKAKSQNSKSPETGARKSAPQTSEAAQTSAGEDFLVVGIGASAGGIQALKVFFENVPADSGAAYVVILHLSPDHDSRLAQVLQTVAEIPVTQVTERVKVEPNHVYVVPPNEHLRMTGDEITVISTVTVEERRAPVDIFFRTLAESHHARAIAVILSGTGANGSMGLKRVKENGGACFAQNPREAEFSEMSRHAIATELVDAVLNAGEIPARIIAYAQNNGSLKIPVEAETRPDDEQAALREIFTLLRVRTGHDFSNYKRPTLLRRIERRINVNKLDNLPAYAAYIRENMDEAVALLKDLLISVTNFFRDKEAFDFLEKEIIPQICEGKTSSDQIRVWTAGCATGEEAYSLAMLIAERTLEMTDAPKVQIFASDIDEQAIATARDGVYTLNDAADVSPERLRRFFTKEGDGYRVRSELREMILFAHHNVLKDPPFSHLDLITCRNLLIYLNREAQERVMETFHFAIEPAGFLFLGNSESVDGANDLYAQTSREHHIYQSRQASQRIVYPVPEKPAETRFEKTFVPGAPEHKKKKKNSYPAETRAAGRISYGDLHLQLLEQYAPSVLVNEAYDIVHLSERAADFLQVRGGGEPTNNLLKLIRQELRLELRTALYQAVERQTNVEVRNLKVKIEDRVENIDIYVRPVMQTSDDTARGFVLVLFEPARGGDDDGGGGEQARQIHYSQAEPVASQLEQELLRSREQLRQTVEQSEVQAEELKASNEELQAMNEEMRPATEELETSKEELQSVNEELITVNQELKVKIEELSLSNNDFRNLINSTDIATIFLDRAFRVNSFTPAASRIFNLIPVDAGRPLADITHRLVYKNLIADAETVLDKLQTIRREVETYDGKHTYLMQVLPYRTAEDRIGGVVLTFTDITEQKRAHEAKFFLASIVESSEDSMITTNFNGTITSWNKAAENLYGYPASEAIGKPLTMLTLPEDLAEVLSNARRIRHRQKVEIYDTVRINKDGREMNLEVRLSPVKDAHGKVIGTSTIARDVTERRLSDAAVRESEERLRLAEASALGTWEWNLERDEVSWNNRHFELFGMKPRKNPMKSDAFFRHVHPEDRARIEDLLKKAIREKSIFEAEFRAVPGANDEGTRWISGYGRVVEQSSDGEPTRMSGVMFDITGRKKSEQALRESEIRFRALVGQSTAGITELDLNGNYVLVNPGFCEMLGYTEAELLKMNLRDVTHPDDYARCRALFEDTIKTGTAHVNEKRIVCRNGAAVWITDSISLITDDDGKPLRVATVAIDITERKQVEEALRESETRLRLLIESASDYAIFTITPENRIDSWNTGAEKVFGWTEKEVLGKSGEIIFTPEDRAKGAPEQEIGTALRMGRALDERFHLRKDGSRFYASGVMTVMKNENGSIQGFAKIARDMTEQMIAEKAVRDREFLQKLVGAQEDERRRIARNLHDELGQQFTALRLKLDAAKKMCDDDELCNKIEEIELIAKSIDDGVDFLAWELRPAVLDDLGLVAALGNYVRQWSLHSGVAAELIASNLKRARFLPEVETNLYRIVQEALNNVQKHAKAKNAEVVIEKRDNLIVVLIEDNGRGFNPENKKNKRKGIGLIGMKERAQLVGGTLEIESAPGKGTTVFVRVPAATVKRRHSDGE